jgi:uncharacterized protein (DUF983 family)
MFKKVCVTCGESFDSLYQTSRKCSPCNLEADMAEMAIWGTD